MLPRRFTVRVYGLLINDREEVLISHEKTHDFAFTKFPGGGLEMGEGSKECLVREFKEETGLDIEVGRHIYTADFFVQSRFDDEEQVIGIYYEVRALDVSLLVNIGKNSISEDFRGSKNEIRHEWTAMKGLKLDMLTFEMDRKGWDVFLELSTL